MEAFFFKHIPCLSITVNFDPDADFVQPLISEWNSGMTCDGLKGVLNHKTVWFMSKLTSTHLHMQNITNNDKENVYRGGGRRL